MAFVLFFLLGIFPIQEMLLFFSFVVLRKAFCFILKKKEKKSVSLAFRASDNGWSHSLMLSYVPRRVTSVSHKHTHTHLEGVLQLPVIQTRTLAGGRNGFVIEFQARRRWPCHSCPAADALYESY